MQPWMIMVDKVKEAILKNNLLNESGQAIFEMILFLPILIFLYTIYYTIGNSISGSINQQKAVRGYFYARVKNNSYVTSLNELKAHKLTGITWVGFNAIGWTQHMEEKNAFAPCFTFSSLLKNKSTETCDGSEREDEKASRFIRLFTVYGVCGATYSIEPSTQAFIVEPRNQALGAASCSLLKQ
jgi:hypothetical protein